jgi:hypothetical protein
MIPVSWLVDDVVWLGGRDGRAVTPPLQAPVRCCPTRTLLRPCVQAKQRQVSEEMSGQLNELQAQLQTAGERESALGQRLEKAQNDSAALQVRPLGHCSRLRVAWALCVLRCDAREAAHRVIADKRGWKRKWSGGAARC